jgi:hypothetical protein
MSFIDNIRQNKHPVRRKIFLLAIWTGLCLSFPALASLSPVVKPLLINKPAAPVRYQDARIAPNEACIGATTSSDNCIRRPVLGFPFRLVGRIFGC